MQVKVQQSKSQNIPAFDKTSAGEPKLRFPGFSGAWEEKRLGEVANFRRGSFPQPYGLKKWYDDENGFPFVQVYDVDDNFRLKPKTKRKISDIAKELSVLVEKGSIVLTIQGSIGRIALTQYDACVDRTLLIFRSFKQPMDKLFFMNSVFLLFEIEKKKAPGGTIKTITKEQLTNFKPFLPQFPEQQKISEFLGAVDEWIGNLRTQKESLESYKKGMMQKIFSQEIRFKDDEGNDFPEWEEKKLGEVGTFYRGHSYTASNVKDNGLLVLRSSNIQNSSLVLDKDLQFVDKKCADEILLTKNDIVICMANGSAALVGKAGVYNGDYTGCVTVGAFCSIFRTKNAILKYIFQTLLYRKYLYTILAGTNINNLKNSDLERMKIELPCSNIEQQKIAEFLTSLDNLIESKQQQISQAEHWKKGLMQGLFV